VYGRELTPTAHVAEGSLPSAVGTATGDTGDTGHGAAGEERKGKGLRNGLRNHQSDGRQKTTRIR